MLIAAENVDLNPVFTWIFIGGALLLLIAEVVGIISAKSGDTITEHWRWLDQELMDQPWIRWLYRVFTIGILVWAALHFAAGIS